MSGLTETKSGKRSSTVQGEPPSKQPKKSIPLFGSLKKNLAALQDSDSDDDYKPTSRGIFSNPQARFGCGLLNKLPNAKSKEASTNLGSALKFIPKVVVIKQEEKVTQTPKVQKAVTEDSDDEDERQTDFLGIKGNSLSDVAPFDEIIDNEPSLDIFMSEQAAGPSKPVPVEVEKIGGVDQHSRPGEISDQTAKDLIYKYELSQFGITPENADRHAKNIIDINVDKEMGPNIHSTIMANISFGNAILTNHARPQPKTAKDKLAKQKHQITYLADLAVKQEETLKDSWAAGKEIRKTAAKKYGF
uniref:Proline-rich protein PRCC n=1 Tax=Rhabditophanes sp. KR3021 TaxID=114890 RepID=A0AC35U0S2_9BILA